MNDEKLRKINELNDEIKKLDRFIYYAELCWSQLSFTEKMKKRFIERKGYGFIHSGEYQLSDELSKKILDVMKEHLECLEKQYKDID